MLPGLIRVFSLPVERVVLLSQCARVSQMFSWRVAMSTCSLFSSLLMTAVFLASPMFSRFSARPVIIARMFQIPSFRVSFVVLSCLVRSFQSTVQISPIPHAPKEEGRLWQGSTLLAVGCPAFSGQYLSSEIRKSWILDL